jgi:hypothetical protein
MTSADWSERFVAWLGKERARCIDDELSTRAVRVLGAMGEVFGPELEWEYVVARADAYASRAIGSREPRVFLPTGEPRDPASGLATWERREPLEVQRASVEELSRVPGIGAATARAIVELRDALERPLRNVEDLAGHVVMPLDRARAVRAFLRFEGEVRGDASEPTSFVELLEALERREPAVRVGDLAARELNRAIAWMERKPYWPRGRTSHDPERLTYERGRELHDALFAEAECGAVAAPLAGQPYIRAVLTLIRNARTRIWISMFGLRVHTAPKLWPLFEGLAAAVRRGVDVRVMYDAHEEPSLYRRDVIALALGGIPARAWPLRGRYHDRMILVDTEHAIVGSVGWTPQSIFRSEELSIYVRDGRTLHDLAAGFDRWWTAAGCEAEEWPLALWGWAPALLDALAQSGINGAEALLAAKGVDGLDSSELARLQREVRWVTEHRLPIAVAALLARAGKESLADFEEQRAMKIDGVLRRHAPRGLHDLAPVGSFLERHVRRDEDES